MSDLESKFKKQVVDRLQSTGFTYFFIKEAASLRGIADIIGCRKGLFFAWELKRDEVEGTKDHGRIVLQKYNLEKVKQARGIGAVVYPENFEEEYNRLISSSNAFGGFDEIR